MSRGKRAGRPFEVLDHTADTGIIAYGATLPGLFENAALGMTSLMFDFGGFRAPADHDLSAEGETIGEVLVGWLGQILAVAEIRDEALISFAVDHLDAGRVRGRVGGVPAFDLPLIGPPIKAVTYHDLAVREDAEGWWARIIFDV